MTTWFIIKVKRDPNNGTQLLDTAEIECAFKLQPEESPYDDFDSHCNKYPDELFFLAKAELYGVAVVKTSVVKTKCS